MAATSHGLRATRGLAGESAAAVTLARPASLRSNRRFAVGHGRLEKLPGVGSGRRLVEVDVGNNRRADKQRALVRIVVLEVDPNRQSLHHLDEIAGRVLRRQQRQRRSGPLGKAGNAPLEHMAAAVHVDIEIDRLADAQVAELRLLEIGVDPDLVERADRHEALADLDIVARIDVSARDDAVDLRDDVAVAEVEFGLVEIALGDLELGLGLLDVRRVRRQPGEDAVDVAFFFELRRASASASPRTNG